MTIDSLYVAAGTFTGLVVGITGVGAGALMTPLLLLVFGMAPATAIATDLWFAAITKVVGARVHATGGQVDWPVVRLLWMGSLPVALATVVAVSSGNPITQVAWLTRAIGATVLITALGLWLAPWLRQWAQSRRTRDPERLKHWQPALTVASGALLGLLVALTSVGAGALGSVMLLALYPLRMTPHRLVATDLVHAVPLAVVAGSGYLLAGKVDGVILLNLLLGSLPAVWVGSLMARRMNGRWIQLALGLVLMVAGVKTLA